jgi:hypothetical protein
MTLCPHGRYLLYVRADGSTWCFCDVPRDSTNAHLNERLDRIREQWDELGRLKVPYGRETSERCFVCTTRIYIRPDGSKACACNPLCSLVTPSQGVVSGSPTSLG